MTMSETDTARRVLVDAVAEVDRVPPTVLPPGPGFFQFADNSTFTAPLAGAGPVDAETRTVASKHTLRDSAVVWDGLLGGTVRSREPMLPQSPRHQPCVRAEFDELATRHATNDGLRVPVSVKVVVATRPA